jgi:hypothetical protein
VNKKQLKVSVEQLRKGVSEVAAARKVDRMFIVTGRHWDDQEDSCFEYSCGRAKTAEKRFKEDCREDCLSDGEPCEGEGHEVYIFNVIEISGRDLKVSIDRRN